MNLILIKRPLKRFLLYIACGPLSIAIWIEKGLGMIIPGFIPGPWGKILEYTSTWVERRHNAGIWAMEFFIFTMLVKTAIPIKIGRVWYRQQ